MYACSHFCRGIMLFFIDDMRDLEIILLILHAN